MAPCKRDPEIDEGFSARSSGARLNSGCSVVSGRSMPIGEIPPHAEKQFKLSPDEILAIERRTHPCVYEVDHIDPIIYGALEIKEQVSRAPQKIVGVFWAKRDGVFWSRQTWTSLIGVYAHRFTFKYIYSAWARSPATSRSGATS